MYVPTNVNVYTAAYSGSVAGMAVSGWITNLNPTAYVQVTAIAGAFAEAFDTVWDDAAPVTWLEFKTITSVSLSQFANRGPGSLDNHAFIDPDNWTVPAAAAAALVLEADAYFASQGIVPGGPSAGGAVSSVFARVGAVVAALNDYAASLISNDSNVAGATVKDALNQLLGPSIVDDRQVYVSKGGSDATGDGTISRPFLTIAAGMTAIVDASTAKRYALNLGPGVYSDDFALKPNVWIVGQSLYLSRINAVNVTLDPLWNDPGVNNRAGFVHIQFRAPYVFDLAAAGADEGYLTFENFSSIATLELRGTDDNAFFLSYSQYSGGIKQVGGFSISQGVSVTNGATWEITDSGVGSSTTAVLLNCNADLDGAFTVSCIAGANVFLNTSATSLLGANTLDGAGIVPQCAAGTFGPVLVLLNGAPSPRPIVTGSRAANPALTSALTGLNTIGVLTDSSVP